MDFISVTYSCGHKGMIEPSPDPERRQSQIKFYEKKGSCPDCYAKMVADRDAENEMGCLKTLMTEDEHKKNFAECKFTRVGVKEPNKRYVFIPYKRIAAEGILDCLGVEKNNQNYSEYYENIINNVLHVKTADARKRMLDSNISEEKKKMFLNVYDIMDGYQAKVQNA